eukprot:TRINITY_DN5379_c0_g2_i1.p1 TRINITY_DN5379_c0_g2~~TRINITY_DN5379_c0_g2_i1.p1  ORF type:complete len:374 (-),score=53.02 TRINITY_DN5379_c0_g2_i1:297-1295(-)
MAVAPMMILTSTKSDLQEHELLEDTVTGYVVDNAPGGNGACEILFERFEEFVHFSEDWASACSSCDQHSRSAWGCALCLYQSGGKCRHAESGLIAACGAGLLKLRPLSGPGGPPSHGPVAKVPASTRVGHRPESVTISQAQHLLAENPAAMSGWVDDDHDPIIDKDSSSSSSIPHQVSKAFQQKAAAAVAPKIAPAAAVHVAAVSSAQSPNAKKPPVAPPKSPEQRVPLRGGGDVKSPARRTEASQSLIGGGAGVVVSDTPPIIPSTPDPLNSTVRLVQQSQVAPPHPPQTFSVPVAPHQRPALTPARRSGDKVPVYLEPENVNWTYIVYGD